MSPSLLAVALALAPHWFAAAPPPATPVGAALGYFVGHWACSGVPVALGAARCPEAPEAADPDAPQAPTVALDAALGADAQHLWMRWAARADAAPDAAGDGRAGLGAGRARVELDPAGDRLLERRAADDGGWGLARSAGWAGDLLVWEGSWADGRGHLGAVRRTYWRQGPDAFVLHTAVDDGDGWRPLPPQRCRRLPTAGAAADPP